LQHCSAVIPASTDTSNTISTNEWVQNAITTKTINDAKVNVANVFTLLQSCSATQPALTDSSTTIPSTAWCQGNLATVPKLASSNTFTANQLCTATTPASTDSSSILATTAFVHSAINNNSNTILLTSTAVGTTSFSFSASSLTGNYYIFTLYNQNGMATKGNAGTSGGSFSAVSGGVMATGMCSNVAACSAAEYFS